MALGENPEAGTRAAAALNAMSEEAAMRVHRCRFAEWAPSGITCLAWDLRGERLAVARENGDVEVWQDWFCTTRIPGGGEPTVGCATWLLPDGTPSDKAPAAPRLVTSGPNGRVVEWDLATLSPRHATSSYGGPVWCMAVDSDRKTVAVGCEDGSVRLFTDGGVESGLAYQGSLAKQRGRVLSVHFGTRSDETGRIQRVIVTGSSEGRAAIWDANTGSLLVDMTLDRFGKRATMAWCLALVQNGNCLAVGDSTGRVTLWDTQFGTRTCVFHAHTADVVALSGMALREGGGIDTLFSASSDGSVSQFRHAPGDQTPDRWVQTSNRRSHSHDIRALAVSPRPAVKRADACSYVVCGGVDTCATAVDARCFHKPRSGQRAPGTPGSGRILKILPVPSRPQFSTGVDAHTQSSFLLGFRDRSILLWRLGSPVADATAGPNTRLPLSTGATPLLELRTKGTLLCEAKISPDARWIAASDMTRGRLWRLGTENKSDNVDKNGDTNGVKNGGDKDVPLLMQPSGAKIKPFTTAVFSPAADLLFVATADDGRVCAVDLSTLRTVARVSVSKGSRRPDATAATRLLCVTDNGKWLAAGRANDVYVFKISAKRGQAGAEKDAAVLTFHGQLPTAGRPITAIAFHPDNRSLVIARSDNTFSIFKVRSLELSGWSQDYSTALPNSLLAHPEKIISIAFDRARPLSVFLVTSSAVCHVDLNKGVLDAGSGAAGDIKDQSPVGRKRGRQSKRKGDGVVGSAGPRSKRRRSENGSTTGNFRMLKRFRPLQFFGSIGPSEMVAVETPWLDVVNSLPPPVYRHKYGT